MSLFQTGIRPAIDEYLKKKAEEQRDYGKFWSASSAGYCMRLNILKRLNIPPVPEIDEDTERTTRVFEVGHIFHEWVQRITKDTGLSIAQELQLEDEDLLVRGHIDDLVLVELNLNVGGVVNPDDGKMYDFENPKHLILYDYKTANSQAFNYKRDEIGHYHKMQTGTYMYMLRKQAGEAAIAKARQTGRQGAEALKNLQISTQLTEARILQISKDDLRMREQQLFYSPALEKEVVGYWKTLQGYWDAGKIPNCTCLNHDGGFMGRRSKKGKIYNPYFYNDNPCSIEWVSQFKEYKEFVNG